MTGERTEQGRLLARLRTAHRVAGIGSWEGALDVADGSLDWSPEVHEIAGWPTDRAPTYRDFVALVHPDDRPAFLEARAAALAGDRPYRMDLRVVRPDGAVRHVHIAAEVVRDAAGTPERLVGVIQDRTEEIELQRRIRLTEASRRQLLQRLLDTSDRERQQVARQLAAGPVADLGRLEAEMATAIGPDAPEAWHDALQAVRRSIASLEATLSSITDAPDRGDLVTVLAELAADLPELDIRADVHLDQPPAPAVRSVAVRLVQEALQNTRKHAAASRVDVVVRSEGDEVCVEVSDDGRGFDDADPGTHRGHFGLASLREDVAGVGGAFTVRSGPGGTTVAATLPLR